MKGVPIFNKRYTKGVAFLSKWLGVGPWGGASSYKPLSGQRVTSTIQIMPYTCHVNLWSDKRPEFENCLHNLNFSFFVFVTLS